MGARLLELILIIIVAQVVYGVKPKVTPIIVLPLEVKKKTTVVLLNNGKTQNAVMVSTDKGSANLDKIGEYVDMRDKKKAPPPPKIMPPEEIKKRFGKVLAAAPKKPLSFMLYFKPHEMALTPASQITFNRAIESMKKRPLAMVDVIGHADTVGTSKLNLDVSLRRAEYIKKMVSSQDVKLLALNTKGFGEEDLLVKTADNVSEPLNRNVEIYIK